MRCLLNARVSLVNLEKNTPIKMNGTPSPNEYASSSVNACPGVVAAKVRTLPKIGPMHGVQHVANASPNTNESG